jgi:formylmethanofuran dehydrogenase subunit E
MLLALMLLAANGMPEAIAEARTIHGAPTHGVPGPWVLLGHRIGKDALARLGKTREQSWDLVVTHHAPQQVKYACVVDGLQASTGTSAGKLNLRHEPTTGDASVETEVRDKKSGRVLKYTPKKVFTDTIGRADYADFPSAAEKLFSAPLEEWVDVSDVHR